MRLIECQTIESIWSFSQWSDPSRLWNTEKLALKGSNSSSSSSLCAYHGAREAPPIFEEPFTHSWDWNWEGGRRSGRNPFWLSRAASTLLNFSSGQHGADFLQQPPPQILFWSILDFRKELFDCGRPPSGPLVPNFQLSLLLKLLGFRHPISSNSLRKVVNYFPSHELVLISSVTLSRAIDFLL